MNQIFFRILNMSIMAGLLSIVVILLRLLFKRVPKWIICLLWAIVALRLIIPFNIESPVSLMPEPIANGTYVRDIVETDPYVDSAPDQLPETAAAAEHPEAGTYVPGNIENKSEIISSRQEISFTKWLKDHLWMIWAAGAAIMIIYALFSFIRLKLKLKASVRVDDAGGHIKVYANDDIVSPFLLGIIRPVIYVPSSLCTDTGSSAFRYVLKHEQAHVSRWDHIWKPLGFLLLSINWFNPLLWGAYILMCRDIEAACDEKVIKDLASDELADYSRTLLALSSPRREIAACPVAFGETGTKSRIKAILNYKKPAFWIIIAAITICIAAAVCLLTVRPAAKDTSGELMKMYAMENQNTPLLTEDDIGLQRWDHAVQEDPRLSGLQPIAIIGSRNIGLGIDPSDTNKFAYLAFSPTEDEYPAGWRIVVLEVGEPMVAAYNHFSDQIFYTLNDGQIVDTDWEFGLNTTAVSKSEHFTSDELNKLSLSDSSAQAAFNSIKDELPDEMYPVALLGTRKADDIDYLILCATDASEGNGDNYVLQLTVSGFSDVRITECDRLNMPAYVDAWQSDTTSLETVSELTEELAAQESDWVEFAGTLHVYTGLELGEALGIISVNDDELVAASEAKHCAVFLDEPQTMNIMEWAFTLEPPERNEHEVEVLLLSDPLMKDFVQFDGEHHIFRIDASRTGIYYPDMIVVGQIDVTEGLPTTDEIYVVE